MTYNTAANRIEQAEGEGYITPALKHQKGDIVVLDTLAQLFLEKERNARRIEELQVIRQMIFVAIDNMLDGAYLDGEEKLEQVSKTLAGWNEPRVEEVSFNN